ncbi:putative ABC transporter ATP-binding protein [Sphaerisporangium siamense]|uniref:Oligopeptide/dipeptide ABC transporter ATP-binding protein n=1 Tax=Sphaerisporangium siamense TaxID=795645 RepID=A0A7W7D3Z9_9ACTN|nr:ABC transporter ATP-binding protein [Sphaerisporangium siamense]MBB4699823.1 oligopeptide/dipeptide ABC transporter ATP-binding protein [Sphaerisporangium siamense]GII84857.1 putative ABC transporter ATP-binding protein [Sphaerisporangium siamense]
MPAVSETPILDVRGLSVAVSTDTAELELVHHLSVTLERGQTLCVVGESGSGKTVTALSIMRLLEFTAPVRTRGKINIDGTDIVGLPDEEMRRYRGRRIGMIFQEALESLNPSQRIGRQLVEAHHAAQGLRGRRARTPGATDRAERKARGLLAEVGLADTDRIMALYPHQLSGGMQQRVMIAMSLMSDPDLLLADEPTTALDVTTQADILDLFRRVQREHRTACVFITHDMAVAAEMADRIAVMYGGRLVEAGPAADMLTAPRHPYTRALLDCVPQAEVRRTGGLPSIPGSVPGPAERFAGCLYAPRCPRVTERCAGEEPGLAGTGDSRVACWHPATGPVDVEAPALVAPPAPSGDFGTASPLLQVRDVGKTFGSVTRLSRRSRQVRAVRNLSLSVARGEFFGLVGESGSGKTTLGRMIAGLERPSSGSVAVGEDIVLTGGGVQGDKRAFRQRVQIVFQDPQSSLDPRYTVSAIIKEPLRELTPLRGDALDERVRELLDEVGLPASTAGKLPGQLSGGQRQRVAIARAIAPEPELIVADEPTSALDVSVQGQVMNLLLDLKRERGLGFVFITHNLSLVLSVADRIGVMYQGEIVEIGRPEAILSPHAHPYTRRLLQANPKLTIGAPVAPYPAGT